MFVGCANQHQDLYRWGNFPEQSYLMYSNPAKSTPSSQVTILEADVQKAQAKGQAIPPGLYAHLGLMYLDLNNPQKARQYFELERQTYPESSTLMERFLKK